MKEWLSLIAKYEGQANELRWMVEELLNRRQKSANPINSNASQPRRNLSQTLERNLKSLSAREEANLRYWISSRSKGKPLQYCLRNQEFLGLQMVLRAPTLIPRWETEEWAGNLISDVRKFKKKKLKILDICSGSGCVTLALAQNFPDASVDGIDISKAAFNLSRLNQRRLGIRNVQFHHVDLFSDMMMQFGGYDVVCSNPPYISPSEYLQLDSSVRDFEDKIALLAPDLDGTSFYTRIASMKHLFRPNALTYLEFGDSQGDLVASILRSYNFNSVCVMQDLAGRNRYVTSHAS